MPRIVYRYIFPGSANVSSLHTIKDGNENPEYRNRKDLDQGAYDEIISHIKCRIAELKYFWSDDRKFIVPTFDHVQIMQNTPTNSSYRSYEILASNVLADLEDAVAAQMGFDQFTQLQTTVSNGWMGRYLPITFSKRIKTRRDQSFVSYAYYIDILSTAVCDNNRYVRNLKKYWPKYGVPCGWDESTSMLSVIHFKI